MQVEYWTHTEVNEDGTIGNPPNPNKGSVVVSPKMGVSGTHNPQTPTEKNSGLYMFVSTGLLSDGMIHGISLTFDNENEMRDFSRTRKAQL